MRSRFPHVPMACLALGMVLGATLMALQNAAPFQRGEGPVLEQTAYYAKPGRADAVYEQRVHASDVRAHIGLPRGRIFRRVDGTGDLPDVIWQLEYADWEAMQRDLDARARSQEFEAVRAKMGTLTANFSRGFYQPATP